MNHNIFQFKSQYKRQSEQFEATKYKENDYSVKSRRNKEQCKSESEIEIVLFFVLDIDDDDSCNQKIYYIFFFDPLF